MAVDGERLLVTLEAKIDGYQASLTRALSDTNQKLGAMEAKFQSLAAKSRIAGGGLGPMAAGMSGVGKAALAAQVASERLVLGMSGVGKSAAVVGKSTATLAAELKNTTSAGLGLGAVFGTLGAYLSATQVIEYANAYTRVNRSLSAGKQIFGVALMSQQELTDLANEARIDVDAYAKTYIRTEAAIRDYGFAAGTGAQVTSTLAKALKLGSASASEQASTILQFSQALQKGKLDGDEFRTVMENAGVVQELLAKRLGVTKGEILKLAADGKLGIKDLVGAMVDGGESVNRIFKQMPVTVDEAFTVLRNNTITYVGKLNEATGATDGLVNVIAILAKNIETVGDVALIAAASLLAMFTPAIIANAGLLTVAMLAAAGPIGIVIGALGGAAAAVALFGNDVKVTEDKVVSLTDRLRALAEVTKFEYKGAATGGGFNPRGAMGRSDGKASSILTQGRSVASQLRKDEREIALGRGFTEGTTTEFGDGVLRKGNATTNSTADANAKLTAYQKETAEVIKRTNALMAQAAVIGESTFKTDHAKVARDLLTAAEETAKRTGTAVSPAQLADIDQAARKYASVAAQVEYLNAVQSKRDNTKALQDEIALVGLQGRELERAKTQQQLLNEAKKAGIDLTPALLAEIDALAEKNAALASQLSTINDIRDQSQEALKGFISDMREGKSASEALGNSLDKIADKLIDMAINGLVEQALGGLGGTGGGGAASGISGITSLLGFKNGGVFSPGQGPANLPRFARGGVSNTAAIFGEAGTEAAVPLPDGRRIPVDLRVPKAVSATSGPVVNLNLAFNVQNGTPEGVSKLKEDLVPTIRKVVRTEVNQMFDRNSRFAKSGI